MEKITNLGVMSSKRRQVCSIFLRTMIIYFQEKKLSCSIDVNAVVVYVDVNFNLLTLQ